MFNPEKKETIHHPFQKRAFEFSHPHSKKTYSLIRSPIGLLKIKTLDNLLESIELIHTFKKLTSFKIFQDFKLSPFNNPSINSSIEDPLHKEVFYQLKAYFKGKLKSFDLPLNKRKNSFHEQVKNALLNIPYGTISTYSALAKAIRRPKAFRAVGNACACNSLIIVAPCHRVLKKDLTLGGFSLGLKIKKKLLEHEGI